MSEAMPAGKGVGLPSRLTRVEHETDMDGILILLGLGSAGTGLSVGPIFPAAVLSKPRAALGRFCSRPTIIAATLWIENYCTATSQNITTAESLFVYFLPPRRPRPQRHPVLALGAFELAACGSQVFADQYMTKQAVYVLAPRRHTNSPDGSRNENVAACFLVAWDHNGAGPRHYRRS